MLSSSQKDTLGLRGINNAMVGERVKTKTTMGNKDSPLGRDIWFVRNAKNEHSTLQPLQEPSKSFRQPSQAIPKSAQKAPTKSKHLDNLFFGWALHDPFFCTGEEHRATRQSWIPTESPHREPMDGDLCLGRDQENGKCYLAQGLLWVAFCFFRCLQPACSCIGSKETRNSWPQSGSLRMGRRS